MAMVGLSLGIAGQLLTIPILDWIGGGFFGVAVVNLVNALRRE
jgi:hypothetical protein